MRRGFKTILALLAVALILFLSVYSVLRYSKEESQEEYANIFYSFDRGENIIISFLYSLADFNWFKSDKNVFQDYNEDVYGGISETEIAKKNIDLYKLIKKSLKINNWSVLWSSYWQNQTGWLNKELRNVVN